MIEEVNTNEMVTEPYVFQEEKSDLLFVYGILKRGFALDLTRYGAKFLGEAQIDGVNLYSIGGGVGLRRSENPNDTAYGELFEIPNKLWSWLDDIEGHPRNYKREIMNVTTEEFDYRLDDLIRTKAWVYIHQYPHEKYGTKYKIMDGIYKGGR